jgi:hypothetical protein
MDLPGPERKSEADETKSLALIGVLRGPGACRIEAGLFGAPRWRTKDWTANRERP